MKPMLAILLAMSSASGAMAQSETPGSLSPEAVLLGHELAGQGMVAKLLPMMAKKETEELIASTPGLTDAEKDIMRAIAGQNYDLGMAKVLDAQSRIYAISLSIEDLKTLTEFNRSPTSQRFSKIQPQVIEGTIAGLDGVDFKGATMKAFCEKTGKGCAAAK